MSALLREPAPELERLLADAPGVAQLAEARDVLVKLGDAPRWLVKV